MLSSSCLVQSLSGLDHCATLFEAVTERATAMPTIYDLRARRRQRHPMKSRPFQCRRGMTKTRWHLLLDELLRYAQLRLLQLELLRRTQLRRRLRCLRASMHNEMICIWWALRIHTTSVSSRILQLRHRREDRLVFVERRSALNRNSFICLWRVIIY